MNSDELRLLYSQLGGALRDYMSRQLDITNARGYGHTADRGLGERGE